MSIMITLIALIVFSCSTIAIQAQDGWPNCGTFEEFGAYPLGKLKLY
jgi:hypothetical protein